MNGSFELAFASESLELNDRSHKFYPAFHSEGLICPNPFKGLTLLSESFEGLKSVGDQTTVS